MQEQPVPRPAQRNHRRLTITPNSSLARYTLALRMMVEAAERGEPCPVRCINVPPPR